MNLEKKNHINALLGFYQPLLTAKQQTYMQDYFGDDFSIIEIAQNYEVSRQAVSDNLSRGVELLTRYEAALHLWQDFQSRQEIETAVLTYVSAHYQDDVKLQQLLNQLLSKETN